MTATLKEREYKVNETITEAKVNWEKKKVREKKDVIRNTEKGE